jgi:hypothetical protein
MVDRWARVQLKAVSIKMGAEAMKRFLLRQSCSQLQIGSRLLPELNGQDPEGTVWSGDL